MPHMNKLIIVAMLVAALMLPGGAGLCAASGVADGLVPFLVKGETNLSGNFYLSFAFSRNLIMLDGKGNIVWSKHGEQPAPDMHTGWWDFKKHVLKGKTYYSYHDETGEYDNYGLMGYAPGERVILDENFNEIKRIKFEASAVVPKGAPLDGHDFLLMDLDHYIMSGYIHDTVYNIPGYEQGAQVVYSYLQEVECGQVTWEWKSIDYPELYALTVTDADENANDFANEKTNAPDYVHFNSLRLDDDGNLVCSFRHISTILCLDRHRSTDQILWKLSGAGDEFGLAEEDKTSCQHYATIDGSYYTVFDNNNRHQATRVMTYDIDPNNHKVNNVIKHTFPDKFSDACGDVQYIHGNLYAIGWGRATKDPACLSVYDFSTNQELFAVYLKNPQNFTYRCVYYE